MTRSILAVLAECMVRNHGGDVPDAPVAIPFVAFASPRFGAGEATFGLAGQWRGH